MLEAGEDPLYIARRLVRMAMEDIGLADPEALTVCMAARDAYHFLGSPEGELALAEACHLPGRGAEVEPHLRGVLERPESRSRDAHGSGSDARAKRAHPAHEGARLREPATDTITTSPAASPLRRSCPSGWPGLASITPAIRAARPR